MWIEHQNIPQQALYSDITGFKRGHLERDRFSTLQIWLASTLTPAESKSKSKTRTDVWQHTVQ